MRIVITIGVIAIAGILAYWMLLLVDQGPHKIFAVTIPCGALAVILQLETSSQKAQTGKQAFEASCISCHGENAASIGCVAPPLVHAIYERRLHGDESFQQAAAVGVRAHHWKFGNIPAVEGVTRGNIKMVTAYIRELQHANGIY